MLECTMPEEIAVRKRWYGAVSSVIASATDDAYVRDAIMAFWSSDSNGWVHTAADDQDNRWRNPSIKDTGDGHWKFDATNAQPTFDAGAHWDCDTDDEVEELTSDAETVPLAATCSLVCVSTPYSRSKSADSVRQDRRRNAKGALSSYRERRSGSQPPPGFTRSPPTAPYHRGASSTAPGVQVATVPPTRHRRPWLPEGAYKAVQDIVAKSDEALKAPTDAANLARTLREVKAHAASCLQTYLQEPLFRRVSWWTSEFLGRQISPRSRRFGMHLVVKRRRQAGVRLVPIETSRGSLLSSLFIHAGARQKGG